MTHNLEFLPRLRLGADVAPIMISALNHARAKRIGNSASYIVLAHAALRSPGPVLLLEMDAHPRPGVSPEIIIPEDADAVYVGLSSVGTHGDDTFTYDLIVGQPYVRLLDMYGAHAIVAVTDAYKSSLIISAIEALQSDLAIDQCMAARLKNQRVYAMRSPYYCQGPETNHHYHYTNFDIAPARK